MGWFMKELENMSLDDLCVNTIRTLAIDAVQKANSGHPGAPMALAPVAYVLWTKIMRYNPEHPSWINRDRFILSNGHASMLLYAMLYLTGYDISLDDLKNFRQWESKTPGHPEFGMAPGVETTTGPLGQGCMNAVGMAIAEAHLAATFNQDKHNIIDHYTYVLCGDGDLMEGASHEAASLAGHLGLGKLIYIYDDNHISIEGPTDLAFSDNVKTRFESYHWQVQDLGESANDLDSLTSALKIAQEEKDKPSLIIVRSHIGYGSPNMQDTSEVHGSPLGEEEVKLTKKSYGWPENEHFLVPQKVLAHMRQSIERGRILDQEWQKKHDAYQKAFPELAGQLEAALKGDLPKDWDKDIPVFKSSDGSLATRNVSGNVLNAIAGKLPWLMGGSADLSPSTKTLIKSSGYFAKNSYQQRNIAWGVREHVMCAACSGMALHGGIRPYASTFFVFTDYARPAIRLAALMGVPVIYVMTHDSIGVGEDGPTHQPIEHLASLRAIPNLYIIRPADANEVAYAWRAAIKRTAGPTMLILTRQGIPVFDRSEVASAEGLLKGAYVLSPEKNGQPDILLLASGSEVQLVLGAQKQLANEGIQARVISMPSWELFAEQAANYRDQVLPPHIKARIAVETGVSLGWHKWVGDSGLIIAADRFGASAPYKTILEKFGFTIENIASKARDLIKMNK
jgi:transketolase